MSKLVRSSGKMTMKKVRYRSVLFCVGREGRVILVRESRSRRVPGNVRS
jgi:hypothetical protein